MGAEAKMMTENMISEQRKQEYTNLNSFDFFQECFSHNIPGIVQEIKASNPINSYDSLFERKLKILNFFQASVFRR